MRPRRVVADLKVTARTYLRSPVALFFSLVFPLILILLFVFIFGAASSAKVTVYTINEDVTNGHYSALSQEFLAALNSTNVTTVQLVSPSVGNLSTYLGQNGYAVGLVIPAGFQANYTANRTTTLQIYSNPSATSQSGPALGVIASVVNAFNRPCPPGHRCDVIQVANENVGQPYFTYIDYLVPGLIGFSILTSPMFSMVEITSSYRKEGLFRQLSLTPLTRAEWLTSRVVWYVLLTFISMAIMLGIGIGTFGANVTVSWTLVPFLVVGPFLFVSLGMLAGSAAKTPESASVIGNLITFPMMFLAGTFFPVSQFPAGLQLFAKLLPLYYVIDGMNQVMLFGNLGRAWVDLAITLAISVVFFALAVIAFRWRDE